MAMPGRFARTCSGIASLACGVGLASAGIDIGAASCCRPVLPPDLGGQQVIDLPTITVPLRQAEHDLGGLLNRVGTRPEDNVAGLFIQQLRRLVVIMDKTAETTQR